MVIVGWKHPNEHLDRSWSPLVTVSREKASSCLEKGVVTKLTHLSFRLLDGLNHVLIVVRQIEEASALSGRGELAKSVVSAYRDHVISCINLEKHSQCSAHSNSVSGVYEEAQKIINDKITGHIVHQRVNGRKI